MSNDTPEPTTPDAAGKRAPRGPRAKAKITDGVPTIAKRAGRPAAPQTLDEAITAYRTKLQTARKAVFDALALAVRFPELDGAEATMWRQHHTAIVDRLRIIDYELHATQVLAGATAYAHPADKIL